MEARIVSEMLPYLLRYWDLVPHKPIKFIFVSGAENLVIFPSESGVSVYKASREETGHFKCVGDIEVPDELIEKCLLFVRAQDDLNALKDQFRELIAQK